MYDWDEVLRDAERQPGAGPGGEDRLIVNMGPQHPSTHGVLRLILEIEGESVVEARCGIGYLHTGIEKNVEYRNWTQAVTFLTRADYLMPLFNETVYCRAVEALLDVEDQVPPRANVIRVLLMELNRISSHLVALATGGMELGAMTVMTNGFRDREPILDILEAVTGNRMNHAYVRPGGLAQDLPDGIVEDIRTVMRRVPEADPGLRAPAERQPGVSETHQGRRLSGPGRLHGPGHHRPHAARRRAPARPAQGRPVSGL